MNFESKVKSLAFFVAAARNPRNDLSWKNLTEEETCWEYAI